MAFLDEVLVPKVEAEAKQVDWARIFLTALAAVFYVIGWTAAKVWTVMAGLFRALGVAVTWSVAAVKVGWREGRRPATART